MERMEFNCHHHALNFVQMRYSPKKRKIWPWPSVLLEEVTRWINVLSEDLWLDAGCGEGQLVDLMGKHKKILGLDIDKQRLIHARTHPYLSLIQGSITSLPFANESLGGIVCVETLEHIVDMPRALEEFSRCLRPNGYLVITMPSVTLRSLWQMRRLKKPVYCAPKEHVRELSFTPIKGFPNRFKTWTWLERQTSKYGFKSIQKGGVGYLFPMWGGKLGWLEYIMNICYLEKVNSLLGKLPMVQNYPYYCIYLFRLQVK